MSDIFCQVTVTDGAQARTLPGIGRLLPNKPWKGELSRAMFDELRRRREFSVQDLTEPPEAPKDDPRTKEMVACSVTFPRGNGSGRLVPGVGKLIAGEAWEGDLPRHLFDEYSGPRHDLVVKKLKTKKPPKPPADDEAKE